MRISFSSSKVLYVRTLSDSPSTSFVRRLSGASYSRGKKGPLQVDVLGPLHRILFA